MFFGKKGEKWFSGLNFFWSSSVNDDLWSMEDNLFNNLTSLMLVLPQYNFYFSKLSTLPQIHISSCTYCYCDQVTYRAGTGQQIIGKISDLSQIATCPIPLIALVQTPLLHPDPPNWNELWKWCTPPPISCFWRLPK